MEPLPVVEVETSSPPESTTVKEVQSFHQSESDTLTKVILNTASGIELERLPGVGPVIANRILEYREKQGPFQSIQELIHIKGIGQKTINKMEPYLLVNSVQERLR
ncbi:ComEA family DNA-binding protein [bacterium]